MRVCADDMSAKCSNCRPVDDDIEIGSLLDLSRLASHMECTRTTIYERRSPEQQLHAHGQ